MESAMHTMVNNYLELSLIPNWIWARKQIGGRSECREFLFLRRNGSLKELPEIEFSLLVSTLIKSSNVSKKN
jgi:hypothetical protein